jgi:AP2 domain
MNDLKKQVAKPLIYYRQRPIKYDPCPKCHGPKDRTSKICRTCGLASRRPPVLLDVIYIEGAPCRMIPLTRGLYTIVDSMDYAMLMGYSWTAYRSHSGNYYARSQEPGTQKPISMHRLLLGLPRRAIGDHKNLNTLDNRRSNLRHASTPQSAANTRLLIRSNTSGYRGVFWRKDRQLWECHIRTEGKLIFLGRFANLEEAVKVRDTAAIKYHGEFARLNFPGA